MEALPTRCLPGKGDTFKKMELRSRRVIRMRSPEEGPRTGAGPGTGVRASGQRLEGDVQERATSRVQPEELPPHGNNSHRHHPRNAAPTRRVATARRQSSTLVGTTRRRIMWTHEMNEFVIRAYYICTALETDMSGRPRILTMFEEAYPEFVGRLDQNAMNARRRAIVRNNMLSQTQVDEIKQQVQRELSSRTNRASDVSRRSSVRLSISFASGARESAPVEATVQQPPEPEDPQPDQQLLRDLVFHYDEAISQFRDTDPLSRPRIPKLQHSRRLTSAVKLMNEHVLPLHLVDAENMEELQLKVYCAAVATAKSLGYRIRPRGGLLQHLRERREPPWRRRLEQRILNKRAAIGRLMAYKRGSRSAKLCRQVAVIVRPTELRQLGAHQLTEKLDTLVQQLSVLTKRLKRYSDSAKRQEQNRMFRDNEKAFYDHISDEKPDYREGLPDISDVTNFWAGIWETPVEHRDGQMWLRRGEVSCGVIGEMPAIIVGENDVREASRYLRNWAVPGPDGVQNFWHKKLTVAHPKIAECFNKVLRDPHNLPEFATRGVTFLLPKDSNTLNPSKYRPITYLSSLYKILSSIITAKVSAHCEQHHIIAEEQKGCRKNTHGCKDQAIIDAAIVGQAVYNQRNLSMAYIDYRKAYDSIPHLFLVRVLELYKIDPVVVRFLQHAMRQWSTSLHLSDGENVLQSRTLQIKRGIFQGDSFSPLWFCLALNPLSRTLNRNGHGYKIRYGDGAHEEVTHTFYMDDLKVYADSRQRLGVAIRVDEDISRDICMEFGLDKCRCVHLLKGQLTESGGYEVYDGEFIRDMVRGESYKYLGFRQLTGIRHSDIKTELRDKFLSRVNCVLRTFLNAGNKVRAINTFAVPLLTFSFGVVKWSKTDLEDLERRMRKAFKEAEMHNPQSVLERVSLPRKEGGLGIVDISALCIAQVRQLREYFAERANQNALYRAVCAADRGYSALHLAQAEYQLNCNLQTVEEKIAAWKQKAVHGAHPHQLDRPHVDKAASNLWLTRGELSSVVEADMIAIQDRIMPTRNCRRYVWHQDVDDICRMCHQPGENIEHIMGGCPVLANAAYTERHNNVARIVHRQLALQCALLEDNVPNYRYLPAPVLENDRFKLYWDRTVLTDLSIHHNRPDIMVYDKSDRKVTIIDVAIPLNQNLKETYGCKICKYRPLAVELKEL
ncbi:uncharacterized protein LOC129776028 [Toxorhynchites rutilus septentrionalis]|uniref:uncharacterized protein LOC129776028 n=1 Tax=Toxorhynchites rutilus septentrionalis TaxID=329112 RepID=UPI00247ABB89|nr:uncharacterized protein LOC129776028 [Toxorhynchites rutilus septentrionalis]